MYAIRSYYVIAGDLFDGMDGNFERFKSGLQRLIARDGVYFVNGNHETYALGNHLTKIFEDTEIINLDDQLRDVDGVQIIGVTFLV